MVRAFSRFSLLVKALEDTPAGWAESGTADLSPWSGDEGDKPDGRRPAESNTRARV